MCEIFDRSNFHDFYTLNLCGVKISCKKIFRDSFRAAKFLMRLLSLILRRIFFSLRPWAPWSYDQGGGLHWYQFGTGFRSASGSGICYHIENNSNLNFFKFRIFLSCYAIKSNVLYSRVCLCWTHKQPRCKRKKIRKVSSTTNK